MQDSIKLGGLWIVGRGVFHLLLHSLVAFCFIPMEVELMYLKEIKKVLMTGRGKIILGFHSKKRLKNRGYSKGDVVSAIFNGEIVERQGADKVAIAGQDKDDNPIIVVIAKHCNLSFIVVTVMPPIDHSRFKICV